MHRSHLDGVPITASDIQESGRVKVNVPVREWPIIEGLDLDDRELGIEVVLLSVGCVRARIKGLLFPALRLTVKKAVEIHSFGVGSGMKFSPNGDVKGDGASFYPNSHAEFMSESFAAQRDALRSVAGSNG